MAVPEFVGKMAGEYCLRRKLGEGGFGIVYEAEHPVLKRRAAVKVLHRAAAGSSDAVQRFIAEAQVVHQIHSRHIVDIFSFGKLADGHHFYIMDLLEGEPLDAYLAREGPLDVALAVRLLRPIVEALDAAHAAGIVHRDLKPQNVFLALQPNGTTEPKLLDFGLAKLLDASPVHTASGTPLGTPLYMSPEQARGDTIDRRADVYALGVLCHELLTGHYPINGDTPMTVLLAHLTQPPLRVSSVNPDLPPGLDEPILRMLDKVSQARPASAGAALAELQNAAELAGFVISTEPLRLRPLTNSPIGTSIEAACYTTGIETAATLAEGSNREGSARSLAAGRERPWLVWSLLAIILFALGGVTAGILRRTPQTVVESATPRGAANVTLQGAAATNVTSQTEAEAFANAASKSNPPFSSDAKVQVRVLGAPPKSQISVNGTVFGDTSGPILLPRGTTQVLLQVGAPGYESASVNVIPDRDLSTTVQLKRRPAMTGPVKSRVPKDLESPF